MTYTFGQSDYNVRRVLIYRLGSLGDTVVALPCFHLVARTFPQSDRVLLTNVPINGKAPPAASVLGQSGLVQRYIEYPVGTRDVQEIGRVWWAVRRFRPEVVVYMVPPRGSTSLQRDMSFLRLCGASNVVGLPVGNLADYGYDQQADRYESEASRLARCLGVLGDARLGDPESWDLGLTVAEKAKACESLGPSSSEPIVSCSIGTKSTVNDWGSEKWRGLFAKLSQTLPGHSIVMLGVPEERALSEWVAEGWGGRRLNLCGKLTPRESAAVMARSELFVGHDSGPMHLAAAVGTPCACAFSAHNKPGVWFPAGDNHRVVYHKTECFGCKLETCIERAKKCMASISIEEMLAAALDAWRAGRRPEGDSRRTTWISGHLAASHSATQYV